MDAKKFEAWKENLSKKIDQINLSQSEISGFYLVLKGFSQSGQDLELNAKVICEALKNGEFKIWSNTYQLHPNDFFAIDFTSDRWTKIIGNAMNTLHARAKIIPSSLRFTTSNEQNVTAAQMFATVQDLAKKLWDSNL